MHSYFCDQCNLEFDVDEEIDETEDSVFCPECKIHLARPLPETPERIIARERRLHRARAAQYKQLMRLILFTLIVLVIVNAAVLYNSRSAWLMLTAGIILGIPAGMIIQALWEQGVFDNTLRGINILIKDLNEYRKF